MTQQESEHSEIEPALSAEELDTQSRLLLETTRNALLSSLGFQNSATEALLYRDLRQGFMPPTIFFGHGGSYYKALIEIKDNPTSPRETIALTEVKNGEVIDGIEVAALGFPKGFEYRHPSSDEVFRNTATAKSKVEDFILRFSGHF